MLEYASNPAVMFHKTSHQLYGSSLHETTGIRVFSRLKDQVDAERPILTHISALKLNLRHQFILLSAGNVFMGPLRMLHKRKSDVADRGGTKRYLPRGESPVGKRLYDPWKEYLDKIWIRNLCQS